MTEQPFPPIFATNKPDEGETVAGEILRMLSGLRAELSDPPALAIATAYLNPGGFALLADEIEKAPAVRLLIGAEPQLTLGRIKPPVDPVEVTDVGLQRERDLTGFTVEADAAARRLVEWLRRAEGNGTPRVEVRRFNHGFLHGKAFIAEHPTRTAFLAGSSNFTLAGLTRNHELNLGYPGHQYTNLVVEWFEDLWTQADPFDLAEFYEERWRDHDPWIVFLRMLWEFYGRGDDEEERDLGLRLTGFQRDGVLRALRLLDNLGGVLVCDEVGLGKTFIAGEIIHQASKRARQRVLVITPAALKDSTWIPFLRQFDLYSNRVAVMSYDQLRLLSNAAELERLDDFALIVIDEAHNLRNPDTQRSAAVKALLEGRFRRRLVLLTATPVNNSLYDLETLISYFITNDAYFAGIGIPSISEYIKEAQGRDPMSLSPEHLFDLMNQVAVRRTRGFIKREYEGDKLRGPDGREIEIEFPTPSLHRVDYEFSAAGAELLEAMVYALDDPLQDMVPAVPLLDRLRERCDDPERLAMARYMPMLFAKEGAFDDESGRSVYRQISATGLLESILLKRLESSAIALRNTFTTMIASHDAFLRGLDDGYVLTGSRLTEYSASEADIESLLDGVEDDGDVNMAHLSDFDADALRLRVEQDRALLVDLQAMAERAAHDDNPKVAQLVALLRDVAAEAERPSKDGISSGDRRKVIVFSTYKDTAEFFRDRIVEAVDAESGDAPLSSYSGRVPAAICGSKTGISQEHRAEEIARFAPATAGPLDDDGVPLTPDAYDVLFATDVLAEGVNLQQAGRMVSLDLPWNPMRLVQRHGRIDRIGSHHRQIDIHCFFPARDLDRLLGLEERLQRKVAYANAALGMGEVLPGQLADPTIEVTLQDTREQIEKIRDENIDILASGGGSAALSGEEYRRRLERALSDRRTRRRVEELPYGSGSGFVSANTHQPGWIFCARIGEHEQPWFRFVAADPATGTPLLRAEDQQPWIIGETLQALVMADPGGPATEFLMPESLKQGVFEAWRVASEDIYDKWTFLTDVANIQPKIPLALREAVAIVAEHGTRLEPQRQELLVRQLSAVWDKRVVDEVRRIVRNEDSAQIEKVQQLVAFVDAEGLEPPPPAEPLPDIEYDDVRLVCWMAVVPAFGPISD